MWPITVTKKEDRFEVVKYGLDDQMTEYHAKKAPNEVKNTPIAPKLTAVSKNTQ